MANEREKKRMTLDVRKAQASASTKRASSLSWFGDVKAEFKKITWTSKDELKVYTKVVVLSTLFVGVGIYLLDLSVQGTLSTLSSLVKAVVT
jgi:preprotein translocase subunit SecE